MNFSSKLRRYTARLAVQLCQLAILVKRWIRQAYVFTKSPLILFTIILFAFIYSLIFPAMALHFRSTWFAALSSITAFLFMWLLYMSRRISW